MGFFEKIKAGLTRTKENIGHSFDQLFAGELNDDFYDELEETLILGDMGVDTTMKAVEELRRRVKAEKIKDMEGARACLRQVLTDMLQVGEPALKLDTTPSVALFIGVNGVGKTTTIGKLSARMKGEGHRVLMAAADTFRAAAADQLEIWSERSGVELVRQYEGADPAAVVFDALTAADIHETSRYLKANGVAVPLSPAVDVDFQLGLFARAVGAAGQDFHFADALRLSAMDAMTAATLTQIFFLGEGGEEPSDSSGR